MEKDCFLLLFICFIFINLGWGFWGKGENGLFFIRLFNFDFYY